MEPIKVNQVNLLRVEDIRTDGGTQSRAALDQATVDEYAQAMLGGEEFPILFAYWDGETIWLADGFHRVAAAKQAGMEGVRVKVYGGGQREALSHSLTANVKHGLRRTNADKRFCVRLMLQDKDWVKWSDTQIAQHCGVSVSFVSGLRGSLSTVDSEKPGSLSTVDSENSETRAYTTKHGTPAVMKTANIGKKKKGVQPKKPDEHGCLACGEIFDKEVWHCPTCNTHWPPSKDTCPNCYKAPTVTTTKLSAAAVADQVFGEGDNPPDPDEAQAIQKPAHGTPDLLEAVNWQALADQYLAENIALKKEIELYHLENHALVQRNTTIQIELTQEKIEFDPNFDPDRDRDYWPEHDTSLVGGKLEAELLEASENRDYWYRLADELRTKLDKSMQKQQKQAVELLNNQNETEVLKLTVKGYYEKIEELKSAMAPLYEELGRVRQELKETRAEADQLGQDKTHWFNVAEQLREELDTALMEKANLQCDLSCIQFKLKTQIDKITDLEAQITSFTSGTADATHAGAHAPARAHSLSSPTIDITHVGDPEWVGKEVKGYGEKGKRKRTPKADPRSSHPAIQAVFTQLGQYPPIELYDRIIEILGDNPDKTKLRQCREEWLTRGYSKANFAWLTEWYVIGIPVRQNNSASNGQPVKSRQLLEWEAKMAMVGAPIPQ